MKTKNIFIIIFIIVLTISASVIAIIVFGSNNTNSTNLQNNASVAQNTQTNSGTSSEGVTLAEVQRNNTISSCMVIYNDNVYKIPSSFASEHEGGAREITKSCGKDITSGFNRVGDHNSTADNMLAGFFFAKLAK